MPAPSRPRTLPDAVEPTPDQPERAAGALMQIGDVADRVGLSLRTVRYYEEQGLVRPHSRSGGGFRLYTQAQLERLELIKQMKPLGFSVVEMRDILDARDDLRGPHQARAAETLNAYAEQAAERYEKQRMQLEAIRGLAGQLRDEAARH